MDTICTPEVSTLDTQPQMEEVKRAFVAQLTKYMASNGRPVGKPPIMGYKELDLYNLFKEVVANGGYHNVVRNVGTWSKIWKRLSNFDPSITDSSYRLKKNYERYLLDYEYHCYPQHREQASLFSQQQNLGSSLDSTRKKKTLGPRKRTYASGQTIPSSPTHSSSSSEEENDPEFVPLSKRGQKRTKSDSDLSSNNGSDEERDLEALEFSKERKRPKTILAVTFQNNLLVPHEEDDLESAVLLLQSLKYCNNAHACVIEAVC